MGRYLAILKDSFHEAISSRVLWVLLFVITLILCGIAPFGTKPKLDADLQGNDFLDLPTFVETLTLAAEADAPSPGKHIWNRLDPDFRAGIPSLMEEGRGRNEVSPIYAWSNELNRLIQEGSIYDPPSWKGIALSEEGKKWAALPKESLNDEQNARLQRLALQAAFDDLIRTPENEALRVTYLWGTARDEPGLTKESFHMFLSRLLSECIRWIVGPITVFVAILVTASIIPNMVEPGSIHLLLSKPISRFWLLLTKYLGGCSFVLVNIFYLLGGLWLIFGLRFGIWESKLLLCIPITLFLFAVYYSVSIWAGLIWRNTIVVIVVSILFWVICFTVGLAGNTYKAFFIRSNKIQHICSSSNDYFAMTQNMRIHRWDEEKRDWENTFLSSDNKGFKQVGFTSRPLPLFDVEKDRLLVIGQDITSNYGGNSELVIWSGREKEGWNRHKIGAAPPNTIALLQEKGGGILSVGVQGIFRLVEEASPPNQEGQDANQETEEGPSEEQAIPAATYSDQEIWERVGPPDLLGTISIDSSAALHTSTDQLVISTAGAVMVLQVQENGQYTLQAAKEVWESEEPTLVAAANGQVILAGKEGKIAILAIDSLEVVSQITIDNAEAPQQLLASAKGKRVALIQENHALWLYDLEKGTPLPTNLNEPDSAWAIHFDATGRLLVVDEDQAATLYKTSTLRVENKFRPKADMAQNLYRYVIHPLYTIFPRPGELNNTMRYLFSNLDDPDAMPVSMDEDFNPWRPVWSSLGFMVFMLALSCLYIRRQEF